jgi:anti-sigma factor RsiW
MLKGFAIGASVSAIAASGLLVIVTRGDNQRRVLGEVVSAHLRSLQGQHVTDVLSSDQHTVKPWFNGRLDVAPPMIDLTALGFTLLGGRLDYVDAKPVAAIVYRRRVHIINLFCAPSPRATSRAAKMENFQGFNVGSWTENGLNLWRSAISPPTSWRNSARNSRRR